MADPVFVDTSAHYAWCYVEAQSERMHGASVTFERRSDHTAKKMIPVMRHVLPDSYPDDSAMQAASFTPTAWAITKSTTSESEWSPSVQRRPVSCSGNSILRSE